MLDTILLLININVESNLVEKKQKATQIIDDMKQAYSDNQAILIDDLNTIWMSV